MPTQGLRGSTHDRPTDDGPFDDSSFDDEVSAALPDGLEAECAIAAVLTAMSARLGRGEAQRILHALPEPHRGAVERALERDAQRERASGRSEVIGDVARALVVDEATAEAATRVVLRAVARALPQGVMRRVLAQLPRGVATLWGSRAEGAAPMRARRVTAFEVDPDLDVEHPVPRALETMHAVPEGFTGASTFSIVACAFARRLSRGEAARIVALLPPALRPLIEPDLANREERPETWHRDELLDRLAERFGIDRPSAELVTRAVLGVLHELLDPHESRSVESQLPEDLAELWRLGQTRLTEVGAPTKVRRAAIPRGPARKKRAGSERWG